MRIERCQGCGTTDIEGALTLSQCEATCDDWDSEHPVRLWIKDTPGRLTLLLRLDRVDALILAGELRSAAHAARQAAEPNGKESA